MKTLHSLVKVAASAALILGCTTIPATASEVPAATVAGDATPSTITEDSAWKVLNAVPSIQGLLVSEDEYRESIETYRAAAADGTLDAAKYKELSFDLDLAKLPDELKWYGYVYKYPDYRAKIVTMQASSPAMNGREIPLAVITPDGKFDSQRPTLYMLNGAGGADQGMDWIVSTAGRDLDPEKPGTQDIDDFYGDRNVNVVIPQAGAFSYYTDWLEEPDGKYGLKGPQKWETFLTKELPGPLEDHINGNGQRGIAGMSMSATSSLLLAEHNPRFFDAVGSYAGCAATSRPLPHFYLQLTLGRGGATPEQMWGEMGGEYNRYNDGLINATKNNLDGTDIYVSAGSGLAGATDLGSTKSSSTLVFEGGAIEAAMSACTHDLQAKLNHEDVPATFNFRNTGTHSWPGWLEDINASWKVFDTAFNAPESEDRVAEANNADEVVANEKLGDADIPNVEQPAPADSLPVDPAAPAQ